MVERQDEAVVLRLQLLHRIQQVRYLLWFQKSHTTPIWVIFDSSVSRLADRNLIAAHSAK
jgi:hypothetical protein